MASPYGKQEVVPLPLPWRNGKPPYAQQAKEVPGTKKEGQTGHYRHADWADALITVDSHPSFPKTGFEMFERGVKDYGPKRCLGHRPFDTKAGDFEKRYVWQTYTEIQQRRNDVGAGLVKISKDYNWPAALPVGIYSVNRPEWQITAQACNAYSWVVVALYDTLGKGVVEYVIGHAEVRVAFAAAKNIPALLEIKKSQPQLDVIVSFDNFDFIDSAKGAKHIGTLSSDELKKKAEAAGIRLLDFAALEKLGKENPAPLKPPKPDDMASIVYTSGTTGNPKGAVYSHRLQATVIVGQAHFMPPSTGDDVGFSFMPLAHCYGRWIEDMSLTLGYRVGYFIGDPLRLMEDIQILQPTWLVAVPRVFNKIYQKVKAATLEAPGVKGALIRHAYAVKLDALRKNGYKTHWLYDRLVFNKVKPVLGGRVLTMGSGSAPLNPDIIDFMRIAFGVDIQEGYGQTEGHGTAMKAIPTDHTSAGTCGPPIPCCELRLVDVPDMGYLSTNTPNPQGELQIRGGNVMTEYYKDPEKSKETVDSEGWLHSGDIAEVDSKGRFKIIDRIKNLAKLSQGEYVALEKVENVYAANALAAQLFLYADPLQNHLILFVVPDPEAAAKLASTVLKKTISHTDQAALGSALQDPAVVKAALAEFDKEASKAHLNSFEKAKQLEFLKEPFSAENDTLTPTMKVKRNVAQKKLKPQADELFKKFDGKK